MSPDTAFSISFGKSARTILYTDNQGTILFTFDFDYDKEKAMFKEKVIILELGKVKGDPERFAFAVEKIKEFLLLRGFTVEIFRG